MRGVHRLLHSVHLTPGTRVRFLCKEDRLSKAQHATGDPPCPAAEPQPGAGSARQPDWANSGGRSGAWREPVPWQVR